MGTRGDEGCVSSGDGFDATILWDWMFMEFMNLRVVLIKIYWRMILFGAV